MLQWSSTSLHVWPIILSISGKLWGCNINMYTSIMHWTPVCFGVPVTSATNFMLDFALLIYGDFFLFYLITEYVLLMFTIIMIKILCKPPAIWHRILDVTLWCPCYIHNQLHARLCFTHVWWFFSFLSNHRVCFVDVYRVKEMVSTKVFKWTHVPYQGLTLCWLHPQPGLVFAHVHLL